MSERLRLFRDPRSGLVYQFPGGGAPAGFVLVGGEVKPAPPKQTKQAKRTARVKGVTNGSKATTSD